MSDIGRWAITKSKSNTAGRIMTFCSLLCSFPGMVPGALMATTLMELISALRDASGTLACLGEQARSLSFDQEAQSVLFKQLEVLTPQFLLPEPEI